MGIQGLGSPAFQTDPQVIETALRRRLWADQIALQEHLERDGLNDVLSLEISAWLQKFTPLLQSHRDPQAVRDAQVKCLMGILRDPLGDPLLPPYLLDSDAVLGSDGTTYGFKSLCIHLHGTTEELKQRSPLRATDQAPFTVRPHPLISHLVAWLRQHNAYTPCVAIEEAYNQLVIQGVVPTLPGALPPPEDIQTIMRRRVAARQLERAQRKEAQQRKITAFAQQLLQPLQQQVQADLERMERVAEENRENQARQQAEIAVIARQDRERIAALQARVKQLEEGTANLYRRHDVLQERINEVKAQEKRAEQDDARLQLAINETERANKAREKGWIKDALTVVAVVGACAFATWAVQGVLVAGGSSASAAVTPLSGGAKLGFAFAI